MARQPKAKTLSKKELQEQPTPTQEISLKTLISALLNEEEKCKERKRTRPYHQNPDRDNYEKKEWLKTIYVLRRLCELKYDPKMDMLKHITKTRAIIRDLNDMGKKISESDTVE
ncbi:unnamed protein product [Aphanomyces euteiches]